MPHLYKQDLRNLKWEIGTDASGNRSRQFHSKMFKDGREYYLKLPYYNEEKKAFTGHESINEVVVSRFLDLLGVDHIKYEPVYADISLSGRDYEVLLCRSENYLKEGETRSCLDDFFKLHRQDSESPLELCKRFGFEDYIFCMILVDYLIMNRDRNAKNLEILTGTSGHPRFVPLFDHGLSLLCDSRGDEEMQAFDVMKDEFSVMYIGTWFVRKNLKLIPGNKRNSYFSLDEPDLSHLFDGIEEFISPVHREKITEMLRRRLEYLRTDEAPSQSPG